MIADPKSVICFSESPKLIRQEAKTAATAVYNWIRMNRDQGRGYHWLSSSPSDVKISVVDYFRMIDVLRDERFSPEGLIKMKNMYEMTMMSMSMCIMLSPIPALGASYLFSRNVRKSHSGYRYGCSLTQVFLPFDGILLAILNLENVECGGRPSSDHGDLL